MALVRITIVAVVLLIGLILSGWWVWNRLAAPPAPWVASAPTPSPTATAVVTGTPAQPPTGYRLAGVAVGEPDSFAVVEGRDGTSALYRIGAEVPGLGRLARIEAERVVIDSATGKFELKLAPAPTPTATTVRTPTTRAATPRPRAVPAGGTTPGSTPSSAPGRPAF